MTDTTIRLEWTGESSMIDNLDQYLALVMHAIEQVAAYIAPILEADAKLNASWTDRTANARQTLNADWQRIAADVVMIWLAHGMDYGKYLESRWGGRYAIIWPTISAHLAEINKMLQGIFK